MQLGKGDLRKCCCIFGDRRTDAVALAGHQFSPEACGISIEVIKITSDMQRIGGRESSKGKKTPSDQPVHRTQSQLCRGNLGNAGRSHFDSLGRKTRFRTGQPARHTIWHQRHDETPVGGHRHAYPQLFSKNVFDLWPSGCQKRQRDGTTRTKGQPARGAARNRQHLGITTKPAGADISSLDHGFPAADKRPVIFQSWCAILQQRYVCGCAAYIGDHGGLCPGQKGSAGKAGSRT